MKAKIYAISYAAGHFESSSHTVKGGNVHMNLAITVAIHTQSNSNTYPIKIEQGARLHSCRSVLVSRRKIRRRRSGRTCWSKAVRLRPARLQETGAERSGPEKRPAAQAGHTRGHKAVTLSVHWMHVHYSLEHTELHSERATPLGRAPVTWTWMVNTLLQIWMAWRGNRIWA